MQWLRPVLFAATLVCLAPAGANTQSTGFGNSPASSARFSTVPCVGAPKIIAIQFGGDSESIKIMRNIGIDLGMTGCFAPLSADQFPQTPTKPADIDYSLWRPQSVDYLIIGTVDREKRSLRFFLIDAVRGGQVIAFDIPVPPALPFTVAGHQVSDLVYERLHGKPGVSDTRVAFMTLSGSGSNAVFGIKVLDLDGGGGGVVAQSRNFMSSPTWSPDGQLLAFVGSDKGQSAIYVQDIASGRIRKISSVLGVNGSPAWSPDGRKIAMANSIDGDVEIFSMDLATGDRRRLTTSPGIDTEPEWSPDGTQIVFTSERDGSPQAYLMSAEGGDAKLLTTSGKQNLDPHFFPDGKSLLVVRNDGGRFRLVVQDLASGATRYLTDGTQDMSPSISANGEMVMYREIADGQGQLTIISADGKTRTPVRWSTPEMREPSWSVPRKKSY